MQLENKTQVRDFHCYSNDLNGTCFTKMLTLLQVRATMQQFCKSNPERFLWERSPHLDPPLCRRCEVGRKDTRMVKLRREQATACGEPRAGGEAVQA